MHLYRVLLQANGGHLSRSNFGAVRCRTLVGALHPSCYKTLCSRTGLVGGLSQNSHNASINDKRSCWDRRRPRRRYLIMRFLYMILREARTGDVLVAVKQKPNQSNKPQTVYRDRRRPHRQSRCIFIAFCSRRPQVTSPELTSAPIGAGDKQKI